MAQEPWRAYLELALGITEASRKKATEVVKRVAGTGGATAEQVHTLVEDLVNASAANREALTRMVRAELERALAKVGLVSADEVAALTARVRELEEELRQSRLKQETAPGAAKTARAPEPATAPATAAVKPVVKKAVKKAAAPRSTPNPATKTATPAATKTATPAPAAKTATAPAAKKATKRTAKAAAAPVAKTAAAPAAKTAAKKATKAAPRKVQGAAGDAAGAAS